jgi:formylmethanofuran dehydrogenase subunit D
MKTLMDTAPAKKTEISYGPKGGMCMTCKMKSQDCSALEFSKMPKISNSDGYVIVRCTAHQPDIPA